MISILLPWKFFLAGYQCKQIQGKNKIKKNPELYGSRMAIFKDSVEDRRIEGLTQWV